MVRLHLLRDCLTRLDLPENGMGEWAEVRTKDTGLLKTLKKCHCIFNEPLRFL
jgi:hypothetical protein